MTDQLITYVAQLTLQPPERLEAEIASPMPMFANADCLDDELLSVWEVLSADARLIAVVLADEIAGQDARNESW